MLFRLIVLLTLVPFIELYLLFKLTDYWGNFAYTVALIVFTGVLGAWLARHEGMRALGRIRSELREGRIPSTAMLDGLLILIAGALLLTPGILTDAVGFLLLVPPTRAMARKAVQVWAKRHIKMDTTIHVHGSGFQPIHREPPPGSPPLEDERDTD